MLNEKVYIVFGPWAIYSAATSFSACCPVAFSAVLEAYENRKKTMGYLYPTHKSNRAHTQSLITRLTFFFFFFCAFRLAELCIRDYLVKEEHMNVAFVHYTYRGTTIKRSSSFHPFNLPLYSIHSKQTTFIKTGGEHQVCSDYRY